MQWWHPACCSDSGHVSRHVPRGVRTLGCGSERPTWLDRGDAHIQYSRVGHPSLGVPTCWLRTSASSPVNTGEIAGRGAGPIPGAWLLLSCWNESPELACPLALRLPVSWTDGSWEALDSPQGVVLRLPAISTCFFFLREFSAFLSSLNSTVDISLITANSSCFIMTLGQGLLSAMAAEESLGSETWCAD